MKAGTKVGALPEEKIESLDFEIKLKFNDRVVKKSEFLELTFESFRACLTFSTKFRLSSNFAQFYEGETGKTAASPRKSLKPSKGGPHLLYDEKGYDRAMSAGLKAPFSRMNNITYKNYAVEGSNPKGLDKRKSGGGLIRERDELAVNKSFY